MTRMLACGILLGVCGQALAGIVGVGGGVAQVPAPADASTDQYVDPIIHAWNERQNVVLEYAVLVNATMPGAYADVGDLTPGAIPAGTPISSHYIHFDSAQDQETIVSGWVTFDAPILGVVMVGDGPGKNLLDSTDFLGAAGTVYPDNVAHRGIELSGEYDAITISPDRMTLIIDQLRVVNPGDHVRIITESLPTPGTLGLVGLGGLLAARRRR